MLESTYSYNILALSATAASDCLYFDSSIAIYRPNLKLFLSKWSANKALQSLNDETIFWEAYVLMDDYPWIGMCSFSVDTEILTLLSPTVMHCGHWWKLLSVRISVGDHWHRCHQNTDVHRSVLQWALIKSVYW
jgi:hypothetical protein